MKKLLFILEHLNIGGVERSLMDILIHLDYSKYEVDLLLYQGKGDYESEIPPEVHVLFYPTNNAFGRISTVVQNAIKNRDWFSLRFRICYYLESHKKGFIKHARKLFPGINKEYDYAVACRHSVISNMILSGIVESKKRIVWWHHGELGLNEWELKCIQNVFSQIDYVVPVSESSRRVVLDHFCFSKDQIMVIPNMICSDRIEHQAELFGVPERQGKYVFCSVGRISEEKNVLVCPEVGKMLDQAGVDFIWYIIGDGSQYESLEEKIANYGMADRYVLTGNISNPYPYVAYADVFIHPSLVESQGIAILEAMALRTPVVVVKSGGPKEYIKNGVNGYLVDNDVNDICDAVQKVINSKDMNQGMIENAYQTAQEYSPERIIPLLEQLFSS